MTMHEGFVASPPEIAEQAVDYGQFLDQYGLGPQEIDKVVAFGTYEGTVGEMLGDPRCPVGAVVAGAYQAEGIKGVEAKLAGIKALYGDFDLKISDTTRGYHEGAVERSDLLKAPESSREKPDFLAR